MKIKTTKAKTTKTKATKKVTKAKVTKPKTTAKVTKTAKTKTIGTLIRTNVNLDKSVHSKAKQAAAKNSISLNQLINAAIRNYIKN